MTSFFIALFHDAFVFSASKMQDNKDTAEGAVYFL